MIYLNAYCGVMTCGGALWLALCAKALSPDLDNFPCVSPLMRAIMGLTSVVWFARGVLIITSKSPYHIDLIASSSMTFILSGFFLIHILGQKLPGGVYRRLESRRKYLKTLGKSRYGKTLTNLQLSGIATIPPMAGADAVRESTQ
jgi:hypothetical protein